MRPALVVEAVAQVLLVQLDQRDQLEPQARQVQRDQLEPQAPQVQLDQPVPLALQVQPVHHIHYQ
jgi:hypothetical protein